MKHVASAFVILLAAASAHADPPTLHIPDAIQAQPGAWVVVSPDTTGKSVCYVALDGLSAFPSGELRDPRKLVVNAPQGVPAGTRYRFVAVATLNDEQAMKPFVIVVGDAPPGPAPGPAPAPAPSSDPLWTRFQGERDSDVMAGRSTPDALAKLASVYRMAAQTTVNDATITTVGALFSTVSRAAQSLVPLPALQRVRETIGEELKAKLPTDPAAPLDAPTRDRCRQQFQRFAGILEALSKL